LFAKQKVAGAWQKKLPYTFTNFKTAQLCQITVLNFANILRHSTNAICQMPFTKKAAILFERKSLAKMLVKSTAGFLCGSVFFPFERNITLFILDFDYFVLTNMEENIFKALK
jgi:hypothetical protein